MTGKDRYIGFYGCSGALVRVEWTGKASLRRQANTGHHSAHKQARRTTTTRPATQWDAIDCPACGNEHGINVTWRRHGELKSDDEFEAHVLLPSGRRTSCKLL